MLNLNRRGFLKGSAGLIGSALLMNVVDVLSAPALTETPPSENTVLWTPEGIVQPHFVQGRTKFPRSEALTLQLCRPGTLDPLVGFSLSLRGSYRWAPVPGNELIITDGKYYGAVVDWWCSYMPLDGGV